MKNCNGVRKLSCVQKRNGFIASVIFANALSHTNHFMSYSNTRPELSNSILTILEIIAYLNETEIMQPSDCDRHTLQKTIKSNEIKFQLRHLHLNRPKTNEGFNELFKEVLSLQPRLYGKKYFKKNFPCLHFCNITTTCDFLTLLPNCL